MKKTISIFILIIFISNFFGQSDKQLDKIADYTCSCMTKKDLKKGEQQQLELELGLCMFEAMTDLGLEIPLNNEKKMTKIGEQIGLRMAMDCKPFLEIVGGMIEEDPDGMMEMMNEKDDVLTDYFYGELTKIDNNQFTTIELKEDGGKTQIFYWFEYFDGANLLKDNPSSIMNKELKLEYEEKEVYLPKYQEYIKIKVIKSLSKK